MQMAWLACICGVQQERSSLLVAGQQSEAFHGIWQLILVAVIHFWLSGLSLSLSPSLWLFLSDWERKQFLSFEWLLCLFTLKACTGCTTLASQTCETFWVWCLFLSSLQTVFCVVKFTGVGSAKGWSLWMPPLCGSSCWSDWKAMEMLANRVKAHESDVTLMIKAF